MLPFDSFVDELEKIAEEQEKPSFYQRHKKKIWGGLALAGLAGGLLLRRHLAKRPERIPFPGPRGPRAPAGVYDLPVIAETNGRHPDDGEIFVHDLRKHKDKTTKNLPLLLSLTHPTTNRDIGWANKDEPELAKGLPTKDFVNRNTRVIPYVLVPKELEHLQIHPDEYYNQELKKALYEDVQNNRIPGSDRLRVHADLDSVGPKPRIMKIRMADPKEPLGSGHTWGKYAILVNGPVAPGKRFG